MSSQLRTCFNGCSLTFGEGFPAEQRDQYIYDRLLAKQHGFVSDNVAMPGSSNYTIFMRSCQALISGHYDMIFTQWTALNRLWLSPGPDSVYFVNSGKNTDFVYRDVRVKAKDKEFLKNLLLILNHDFQNILDVIDYCQILTRLADQSQTKLIFINGLLPWQSDLVRPLDQDLGTGLSDYTKEILDFENRDDEEIRKFFTVLQEKFKSVDQSKWVNIFDSFFDNEIDTGPEGHHPGVLSHRWMADRVSDYLEKSKLL